MVLMPIPVAGLGDGVGKVVDVVWSEVKPSEKPSEGRSEKW